MSNHEHEHCGCGCEHHDHDHKPMDKYMTAINQSSVTIDDIFTERHLELCGEGKRYFDLVRAEGISGAIQKASTILVPDSYGYRYNAWTPSKKYIPLAQSELDADPTLKQNNY